MSKQFPLYDICEFPPESDQDVVVSRFGIYLKNLKKLHFPHRHDFYQLILFTEGGGSHSIDFENFRIVPFHMYFLSPKQVHGWYFEGNMDGYVVNFSAQFFQSFLLKSDYLEQFPFFFSGNVADSVMDVPEKLQQEVIFILEKILAENDTSHKYRFDTIRVLILQLLYVIGNFSTINKENVKETYNVALMRSFETLIEKNYLTLRLPKLYAELLYITPNHLNALCNDIKGISAGDMIRNRIILEAKRLLISLDMTVTEVAYALNFDDNSYFCKFFKKQEGVTPEVFRKQLRMKRD
ncbi:transcriptional regulator, AraC family [Mucilaginibacter pineti]|uniref:Transcriptional regulator, AraC family n=1 Tax=Mucilaginibacter pineti TaxID=1391627 RepID=A0A1G7JNL5_9SPHI|nr:helix-turn-helix transcriptional regulator [Mucilaginibacter pineti]SDF26481.1 transcriptional regulator, AraC family [Mucilaginibacter pineti]